MKDQFKIGDKVISRSNNDEPYHIGIYKGTQNITKANTPCPIVEFDGEIYLCMSILKHWSQELCDQLDKLSYKEQWNLLSEHYKRI